MIILTKPSYFARLKTFGKVYDKLPSPFPKTDLVISYCYPRRIPKEVYSKYPTFNFHPAPSKYKGIDPYSDGFHDNVTKWGVTVFKIETDEFDSGPINDEYEFHLGYPPESREDLRAIAHHHCFEYFKESMEFSNLSTGFA